MTDATFWLGAEGDNAMRAAEQKRQMIDGLQAANRRFTSGLLRAMVRPPWYIRVWHWVWPE